MRKHSRKMLALGVVCLTFLFILSSLFGCKLATIGQSEPEYKIVQLYYDGEYYPFKIPGSMPDFTQFVEYPQLDYYAAGMLATLTYFIPDSPTDDQYFFLVSNIPSDLPVVLGLGSYIGDEYRYWFYEYNLPVEVTKKEAELRIEAWIQEKQEELYGGFEEEEEIKPI